LGRLVQEVRKTTTSGLVLFFEALLFGWKLSSRLERVLGVGAKYSETGEAVRGGLRELNGQEWYRQLCAELLRRFRENAFGIPDVELLRKITSY
jgi:hypothetical protein